MIIQRQQQHEMSGSNAGNTRQQQKMSGSHSRPWETRGKYK